MISINKMSVEGFASIKDEKFNWGLPGLNIIQANNGVGKTKFINALVWCLYGKTLAGSVEPWEYLRDKDYKGTKVSVFFNVNDLDYQVIRCKSYKGKVWDAPGKNRLVIVKDGKQIGSERDKLDHQRYLEELLGYSIELFKNSVVFGQKLKRLISESGPNKKKVFDEALELLYIPKAKKLAEEEKAEAQLKFNKQDGIYEKILLKIESQVKAINREQEHINNFEEDKKKEIKTENDTIGQLEIVVAGIDKKNPGLLGLIYMTQKNINILKKTIFTDNETMKMTSDNAKVEYKIGTQIKLSNKLSTDKLVLENEKETVPIKCPECGHHYDKADVLAAKKRLNIKIKDKKKEYDISLDNLTIYRKELEGTASDLSSAIKTNESYNLATKELNRLESIEKDIADANGDIEKCMARIEKIKGKTPQNNIEELTRTLSDLEVRSKKEKHLLRKLKIDLKVQTWLINGPLSNSGLKAFIFDQMLDNINERLHYYSRYIGFQVYFIMDMESARKDLKTFVYKDDEAVPYDDLSGGQQQSVDIVTAFAIHDIVNEGREINLLIMDEVFESLDKDNIEIISELINDKAADKNLFLVTHRAEFAPTNANIIRLTNHKGITSVV